MKELAEEFENCGCLEKVRNKLTAHYKSSCELELKQAIDPETLSLGRAIPPLYFTYYSGKKRKRSFVVFTYCPFCGKKGSP